MKIFQVNQCEVHGPLKEKLSCVYLANKYENATYLGQITYQLVLSGSLENAWRLCL